MRPRVLARHLLREFRGRSGRWIFFILCLAVGVAAIVAVAGLAAGVTSGIRSESRQLMAADLVIEGRQALPADVTRLLAARSDLELAGVKELVTVVATEGRNGQPGRSQLVELKAVEAGYPFYGQLDPDPVLSLAELLGREGVAAAPDLLTRLELELGDDLLVGGQPFRILAVVAGEPDRIGGAFALGPRLFLSMEGLGRTSLEGYGSMIRHRQLIRLAPDADDASAARLADELRQALPASGIFRVESHAEGQPGLQQGIERLERFLGLVALLSLLVGGIGVAQTARAWLASRMGAIAVLRCLGFRPREVFAIYLGQTLLLALAGSLLGVALGTAILALLPGLMADILPAAIPSAWQPAAVLRGLLLGVGVAVAFCLPPLVDTWRVPPVRVLRREAEPLESSRWVQIVLAALLIGGVGSMASAQSGSIRLGGLFTLGVATAAATLALAAWLIVRAVRHLPRDLGGLGLRYGLAALARPGAATAGAMIALGIGVLVVLGMSLVESQLAGELDRELPPDSPTAFLIDIQPDQWSSVEQLLVDQGVQSIDSVPVVTARLTEVAGRPVSELVPEAPEHSDRRWALTREQRLTYLDNLPADNLILEGSLWSDPELAEVSVEQDFAAELGVGLGSTLDIEIQGVPLELTVTSIRKVDWQTFGINFFLVVEPGVLDDAPQSRLAAARLPEGREQEIQDRLATLHPNITLFRIRQVLEKVSAVLSRLGLAVRLLGGFTVLAGIVILAGAVSAGSLRRAREVALLKTLGVTRRGVATMFTTEYALIGLVAGLIGVAGASVMAWFVLTRGMEVAWSLAPGRLLIGLTMSVLVTVGAGLAASRNALTRRPIQVLRGE